MAGKSPSRATEKDRKELRRPASSVQNLRRKRVIWSRIFNFANTSARYWASHIAAPGTLLLCTEEHIAEIHRLRRLRADFVEKGSVEAVSGSVSLLSRQEITAMMGDRKVDQAALFYEFLLERHVPADHLLRAIDRPRRPEASDASDRLEEARVVEPLSNLPSRAAGGLGVAGIDRLNWRSPPHGVGREASP